MDEGVVSEGCVEGPQVVRGLEGGEEEVVYNVFAGGDGGFAGVEVAMFILLAGVHVVEVVADDYRVSVHDCLMPLSDDDPGLVAGDFAVVFGVGGDAVAARMTTQDKLVG